MDILSGHEDSDDYESNNPPTEPAKWETAFEGWEKVSRYEELSEEWDVLYKKRQLEYDPELRAKYTTKMQRILDDIDRLGDVK